MLSYILFFIFSSCSQVLAIDTTEQSVKASSINCYPNLMTVPHLIIDTPPRPGFGRRRPPARISPRPSPAITDPEIQRQLARAATEQQESRQ